MQFFLDNVCKDFKSRKEAWELDKSPHFLSTFSALFVKFIFIFENGQNSFSCGTPFGLFWYVNYLNIEQKLQI